MEDYKSYDKKPDSLFPNSLEEIKPYKDIKIDPETFEVLINKLKNDPATIDLYNKLIEIGKENPK